LNIILRVAGFGILIMLIILVPLYKIYGLFWEFWVALAACLVFTGWSYFAYRRIYSAVICPKCGFKLTYLQVRKLGSCPKCGRDLQSQAK
jgi:hypothetical protein